jgi:hypothetical protein
MIGALSLAQFVSVAIYYGSVPVNPEVISMVEIN